jgi:hypothetical protein
MRKLMTFCARMMTSLNSHSSPGAIAPPDETFPQGINPDDVFADTKAGTNKKRESSRDIPINIFFPQLEIFSKVTLYIFLIILLAL